jgi:hypothetical protein
MMMLLPHSEALQDNIPGKSVPVQDSVSRKSDSISIFHFIQVKDSVTHRIKPVVVKPILEISDTISVCKRNSIEDVTFYDSNNVVTRIETIHRDKFPFLFTERNSHIREELKTSLVKHLRPGDEIRFRSLHDDWITLIMLCVIFLFAIVRKSADSIFQGVQRFFLFRGVNNPSSRDIGGLFTWESTIKNLISFFILGLFSYSAASYQNIIPSAIGGIIFWIITVIIIIIAVTLRHLVCLVTGVVSGEREVFTEYLLSIYQFYRFSALFTFVVTILMSYTTIFPVKLCFMAGVIVLATLYLIRVIRLFIIFINKNISLFYLILYLCALEILPVVISIKYISGLT